MILLKDSVWSAWPWGTGFHKNPLSGWRRPWRTRPRARSDPSRRSDGGPCARAPGFPAGIYGLIEQRPGQHGARHPLAICCNMGRLIGLA